MATVHRESPGPHGGDTPASGIIDKVRDGAAAQLTAQKDKAVEGIGSVTSAVRQSTQQLREQQHDTLAGYVDQAANTIDRLSQQLREKDVGELFEDAQRLARRQPALFIGSAFALGLMGARFLKSSSRRHGQHGDDGSRRQEFASDTFTRRRGTSARDYAPGKTGDTSVNTDYTNPTAGAGAADRTPTSPSGSSKSAADTGVTSPRSATTSRSRTVPRTERS